MLVDGSVAMSAAIAAVPKVVAKAVAMVVGRAVPMVAKLDCLQAER